MPLYNYCIVLDQAWFSMNRFYMVSRVYLKGIYNLNMLISNTHRTQVAWGLENGHSSTRVRTNVDIVDECQNDRIYHQLVLAEWNSPGFCSTQSDTYIGNYISVASWMLLCRVDAPGNFLISCSGDVETMTDGDNINARNLYVSVWQLGLLERPFWNTFAVNSQVG